MIDVNAIRALCKETILHHSDKMSMQARHKLWMIAAEAGIINPNLLFPVDPGPLEWEADEDGDLSFKNDFVRIYIEKDEGSEGKFARVFVTPKTKKTIIEGPEEDLMDLAKTWAWGYLKKLGEA